ncbi:MAG: hypothetical protein RMJ16_02590 [Thermoguttaceae bacterium]|nr:hypothetical protein [Thermoguttaceae bacterium]
MFGRQSSKVARDRWKFAAKIIRSLCHGQRGVFLLVYPEPIEVLFLEAPALVETSNRQNRVLQFLYRILELRSGTSVEDLAEGLALPVVAVQACLSRMRLLGLVSQDAAGRWQVCGTWSPSLETMQVARLSRVLLCYWLEKQKLLPAEPRLRLRDLISLEIHAMQQDLRPVYDKLVEMTTKAPIELSDGSRVRLLTPSGRRDTALADVSGSANSVQAHFPFETNPEAPGILKPYQEVLVTRCQIDVLAVSWLTGKQGSWYFQSRLWSRPVGHTEISRMPFAPGSVIEGVRLLEEVAGTSLAPLREFFYPGADSWQSLVDRQSCPELKDLRRTLHPEAPALLEVTLSSEARLEYFLLPTTISPSVRLVGWNPGASLMASRIQPEKARDIVDTCSTHVEERNEVTG